MKNIIRLHFIFIFSNVFIFIFQSPSNILAQFAPGSRQVALSHSDIAMANDVYSIFNNPAGSAQINWREAGVYYSPSPFGLKQLANASAAYLEPTSLGTFSVGFITYGFELYRENKFALSFSKRFFHKFFLGLTFQYQNLSIKNYGNSSAINLLLGGLVYLENNLRLGFAATNLLRSTYGNENDQIPVTYASGISYDLFNEVTLNLSLQKDLNFPFAVHAGIEYLPIKFLSLRFGISTDPSSFSGGIGINYSFLHLDYAFNQNPDLGISHQFGIILSFHQAKNRLTAIKDYLFPNM